MSIDDDLPNWDWRSAHTTRVTASPERRPPRRGSSAAATAR